jgi:hypothetical protein
VGGNWSSIVGWAEESSASVQQAYCYPAAEGASSYDVAVTAVGGNRTLPSTILTQIAAYILARMPGEEQLNVTTVTPQGVDVSLKMRLPLPATAGGPGGGWRDAAPWPQEDCKVTGYSGGVATVNSTASPAVGNSIGVWNPNYEDAVTGLVIGQMIEYSISAVGGSAGAWTIQVQGGFQVSPLGQYVSAGANYLVEYARAFADAVALLGPGQKTQLPELLPRALRQPSTDTSTPSDLTSTLITTVQEAFTEMEDLQYGVAYAAGTTTTLTSPPLPMTTADPPNILVLNSVAFRFEP